jgi:hypothetical protein
LEDFPDLDPKLEPLIDRLNEVFQPLYDALRGGIRFEDNFKSEKATVKIAHDTNLEITLKKLKKFSSVIARATSNNPLQPYADIVRPGVVRVRAIFNPVVTGLKEVEFTFIA